MEQKPGELPIPDRPHENYIIAALRKKNNIPLVFDIELFHQGSKVFKGLKYWIGCELIGPIKTI